MIPGAKIMEILEDCAEMGVKAIQLTGGGEPTVHPKHPEAMAKILDLGMELSMVTNGQVLRDAAYESLCRATWLRVSIDAGNRKSYAAIRRINSDVFDRVWGNVERLAKGKSASTELGCGFVVTADNWTEIGDFLKRAKESGANNARISAFFQNEDERHYGDRYEEILSHLREQLAKYESDSFSIHNNFADRYADMAQKFPEYGFCGYQKFTTYIGADLNVYRCCNTAYSSKGVVGNLAGQRFREMWADAYQSQRDFDPSSNCPRCQFNRMNEVINYVSIDEPTHANYP